MRALCKVCGSFVECVGGLHIVSEFYRMCGSFIVCVGVLYNVWVRCAMCVWEFCRICGVFCILCLSFV